MLFVLLATYTWRPDLKVNLQNHVQFAHHDILCSVTSIPPCWPTVTDRAWWLEDNACCHRVHGYAKVTKDTRGNILVTVPSRSWDRKCRTYSLDLCLRSAWPEMFPHKHLVGSTAIFVAFDSRACNLTILCWTYIHVARTDVWWPSSLYILAYVALLKVLKLKSRHHKSPPQGTEKSRISDTENRR